jgi:hypothetical protein
VLARASAALDSKDPQERRVSMTTSSEIVLLGDIGATNARFALLTDGVLGSIKWIEARDRLVALALHHQGKHFQLALGQAAIGR